jgi:release factor glutamine methyltransferase
LSWAGLWAYGSSGQAPGQPRPTWGQLLAEAQAGLGSAADARRIVERASGCEGADYYEALDDRPGPTASSHFRRMVERRAAGEPLQYVLGEWSFRSLDLLVDSRVLIPRPETEVVVEVAVRELGRLSGERGGPRQPLIVELGTGSGAIALSLATEVPSAEVWATDRSPEALAVARANLAGIGRAGTRVRMAEGSWFGALPPMLRRRVDLVVSNPPYVAEKEVADLAPEVARWEPREALVAGPTGLEQLEIIIDEAPRWLTRPGTLVLEIAPHQAPQVVSMAYQAGFLEVDTRPDLAGWSRALVARL